MYVLLYCCRGTSIFTTSFRRKNNNHNTHRRSRPPHTPLGGAPKSQRSKGRSYTRHPTERTKLSPPPRTHSHLERFQPRHQGRALLDALKKVGGYPLQEEEVHLAVEGLSRGAEVAFYRLYRLSRRRHEIDAFHLSKRLPDLARQKPIQDKTRQEARHGRRYYCKFLVSYGTARCSRSTRRNCKNASAGKIRQVNRRYNTKRGTATDSGRTRYKLNRSKKFCMVCI